MYWRAGQLGLIPATNQSIRVISLVCVLAAGIGPSWPTLQCWMQGVQGSKAGISAEFSWVVVVYKGPPWLCLTWAPYSENALPLGLYLTLKTTLEAIHNFNIRPLAFFARRKVPSFGLSLRPLWLSRVRQLVLTILVPNVLQLLSKSKLARNF